MRGDDLDTIFDQWSEGQDDATEIECVILLDNSGSMSGSKETSAYRAMYAIKRALDRINANTTVITFNTATNVLYRADEKATGVMLALRVELIQPKQSLTQLKYLLKLKSQFVFSLLLLTENGNTIPLEKMMKQLKN
jgi:hypothetical protein